jgi:putative ABC transport system permease protein
VTALWRWLTSWLVRALPAVYRERVAADLNRTMRDLAADARQHGTSAEHAYWRREGLDLLRLLWETRRPDVRQLSRALTALPAALVDDGRTSVRQARRRPMATVGVIAMVAAAVAAVTITFGLASAVLWRPLPFPEADRLVFVWEAEAGDTAPFRVTSGRFSEWERDARSLASLAVFGAAGFSLDGPDGGRPIRGLRVSSRYFETLGVEPERGRTFTDEDAAPGRHNVVVLAAHTWRSRFGSDDGILGRTVRLSGEPYEVIGVMPDIVTPGWPSNPAHVAIEPDLREFWVPIPRTPAMAANTRAHVFGVVARLRDGSTPAQASAELTSLRQGTDADPHGGVTRPFRDQFVGDARAPFLVLLAAALVVLLVSCANLAALQVSRFEQRRGELVTRLALGAGRVRLAGLLASDAAALSALGGLTGVLVAERALAWIPSQVPASVPFITTPQVDGATAVVACLVTGLVTLGLSVWPIGRLSGVTPSPRGVVVPPRPHTYRLLVAAQLALAVALAVPASLLGQSLATLRLRDTGFRVDGVVVADVSVPAGTDRDLARVMAFETRVRSALATMPGVGGAALVYDHPLEANWIDAVTLLGDTRAPDDRVQVQLRIVSPGYFDLLGVEVLDGRTFDEREDTHAPGVVVVNEAFAAAHGRVMGRRLPSGAAGTWAPDVPSEYVVVGVVENERFRGVERAAEPALYLSTRQFPLADATILVRADAEAPRVRREIRAAVAAVAQGSTVGTPRMLDDLLSEQLSARRMTAEVVGGFAVAATGLSLLGLYGLMAMMVASRTRDVGVRLAIGASPRQVAGAVIVESLHPVVAGVAAGVGLALGLGRFVSHLLVDVSASDPWTLASVAAVLVVGAILAAAIPARRAARVDPVVALRAGD